MKLKSSHLKKVKDTVILFILIVLMPFAPIALLLMWRYVKWTNKTKWIVTGIVLSLFILGVTGFIGAPPNISVEAVDNHKVAKGATEYEVKGDISSFGQIKSFKINGDSVELTKDRRFSHTVPLEEGANRIELVAVNDNGESKELVVITRPTKAELEARAVAEKEKQAKSKSDSMAAKEKEAAKAKAQAEAREADEASKKAEKEKAKPNCNFWCKLTGGDKQKENENKIESKCNFWCKLTGGAKSEEDGKLVKEKAAREKARKEQEAAKVRERLEAKKAAEAAAAKKRVQDLMSCSIDVSLWTDKEINDHREKYGECGGFDLISVCEQWFKSRYPYKGSKMHWIVDLRQQGKMPDGSKYLIVGVTIENAFGAKRSATLECAGKYAGNGMVSNTVFNVY